MLEIIVSIVATAIVSIMIARWQMRKNEITHFFVNSFNVGKGLHNEFPQFNLTYEGEELSNEVLVLKGCFLNSGRNDIIGLKNNSDLKIILPAGCSLKDIVINKSSNELTVVPFINKDSANIISFAVDDKFMSGECFEYTAIVESTKDIKNLRREIKFKHRIPNTSKIKEEFLIDREESEFFLHKLSEKGMGYFSFIATLFFCCFSLWFLFQQKVRFSIVENDTNKEFSLYITPQSQLYVSDSDFIPLLLNSKKITEKELNRNYKITPNTNYIWESDEAFVGISLAFFSLLYLFVSISFFRQWNVRKHIYKLLNQHEQKKKN